MLHRLHRLEHDASKGARHTCRPFGYREERRDDRGLEVLDRQRLEPRELIVEKHRRLQAHHPRVVGGFDKHRVPPPQVQVERHHQRLPQGINRRVGHLREHLAKVVINGARPAGERSERRVVTHRAHRLFLLGGEGLDQELDVFFGVSGSALEANEINSVTAGRRVRSFRPCERCLRGLKALGEKHLLGNPPPVFPPMRDLPLHLMVLEDLLVFEVHKQDLAGTEAAFFLHALRLDGKNPDLRPEHHQAVVGERVAVVRAVGGVQVHDHGRVPAVNRAG